MNEKTLGYIRQIFDMACPVATLAVPFDDIQVVAKDVAKGVPRWIFVSPDSLMWWDEKAILPSVMLKGVQLIAHG